MTRTIYTTAGSARIRGIGRRLARILSGSAPDEFGIAHGFRLRLAATFWSKVKQAFVVKSRSGTDEAGYFWPPLKPETLAYSRKKGEIRKLTKQDQAAVGGDKFARKRQFEQLKRELLPQLAARMTIKQARAMASQTAAMLVAKAHGTGKSKIAVARTLTAGLDYDILRDTGILFNSISPGVVTDNGADASYALPDGQTLRHMPSEMAVGTNVAYAASHHYGSKARGIPCRSLWPSADRVPQSWITAFVRHARSGLIEAVYALARRAA